MKLNQVLPRKVKAYIHTIQPSLSQRFAGYLIQTQGKGCHSRFLLFGYEFVLSVV